MFKRSPNLSRFSLFMLLPLFLLFCYLWWTIAQSAPRYTGSVSLDGIAEHVEVRFNDAGIPQVNARTDDDAYFAQGYLHAAERLWQMELQRRLSHGRTAEVFGQPAVATDIWMRRLGLQQAANSAWLHLPERFKRVVEQYTAGINAYLTELETLPPEFIALGVDPKPWQVTDILAWQKVFALNLGLNMYQELNRLAALKLMSGAQLQTFYPDDPDYGLSPLLTAAQPYEADVGHLQLAQSLQQQWSIGGKNVGSNAWVVAGRYTESGLPIVANDPHLSVQMPSSWYAMGLKGDTLNVRGMSLVGLPGVLLGSNEQLSWGAASLMADQQDLFILDVPLGRNAVYLTEQGPQPIRCTTEQIRIRPPSPALLHNDIEPLEIETCHTDIGPLIGDRFDQNQRPMALRWSALDPVDNSLGAFIDIQYADGIESFRTALGSLKAPGLHFVYADQQGNIASQAAGHIPRRGAGVGVLPNPAFKLAHRWQGYVPFEQLPHQLNPQAGYVVVANAQVQSVSPISHEWASDARMARIGELLDRHIEDGDKLTLEDTLLMQMDWLDVGARAVVAVLKDPRLSKQIMAQAEPAEQVWIRSGLDRIAAWQGGYEHQSEAASIYFYWFRAIKNGIFSRLKATVGEPREGLVNHLLDRLDERVLLTLLQAPDNLWCERQANALIGCQQAVIDGFIEAMQQLKRDTRQRELDDWAWGEIHYVDYRHKPFGSIKILDLLYADRRQVGGSANTINAANAVKDPNGRWRQNFGAAFRYGMDLGHPEQAYVVIPGGQSGHIMSRHFADMYEAFDNGGKFHFVARPGDRPSSILHLLAKEQ